MSRRSFAALLLTALAVPARAGEALPDTKPLNEEGDLAAKMVEGIDKYLTRELAASVEKRQQYWKLDCSSPEAYAKSVQPNRERLKKLLGVVDERVPFTDLEYVGGPKTPPLVAETDDYKVYAVRWPALPGVEGDGLLLEPKGEVKACVVAIPDADWTPEMLVGLAPGVPEDAQFARLLAEKGCRVLVPMLIDRKDEWSGNPALGRLTNQPHREFVYRQAYELGRHVIGYEVQKVLAAVDWFCREKDHPPVGVAGYGEGGLVAFYSGAVDERIRATAVVGYFGPREGVWREPIYRNVFGLLREFGDAEVALLVDLPVVADATRTRHLLVGDGKRPAVSGPPAPRAGRGGAAPGAIEQPDKAAVDGEYERVAKLVPLRKYNGPYFARTEFGGELAVCPPLWNDFLGFLGKGGAGPKRKPPADLRKDFDSAPRQHRQFDQLVEFTQKVLRDSERVRQDRFWSKLDLSSVEKYEASCRPFRKEFDEEVIGKPPPATEPLNPRSRLLYDEPKWKGYEVALDIYPDVFAYGILLLPKDLKPGEKRPVVVCQHGLEGRPTDVCNPKERTKYYNSFGAQLADLGYIVYAPQNPYIGGDKFRVLQRKANPLGLSLFSFIVRQHATTLDWLTTLPNVDPGRIAFYGLSYGGKTAMRVPALEPRYCLSICSGDFNEWVAKNASVDFRGSYMFSPEYEMPEFNLGQTFNYAEMAALIAPRPFMVERGHDDGVGVDEMVAYEYAKVRRLYDKLGVGDRTEIEFFNGGHEVHAQGTFRFLKKHLKWPAE
jgi:dienelactone hydrolase